MAHVKSGSGHLPQKFRKIRNVMDKPDPYMAWKDARSLLTPKTERKSGVIKVSDLAKKKEAPVSSKVNGKGLQRLRMLLLKRKKAERQQFSNISNKNKGMPTPSLQTKSPY